MIKFTYEDNKEAMLKAFELFTMCMSAGPCNNCIFFDSSLQEDKCSIGCPNSWPLFDPSTIIGNNNRKIVLDLLHKKEKETTVSEAVKELDPVINECPCNKCSDEVKMLCNRCVEYYDWIEKLKGEGE